ncbi:MAG: NADH-quinone oxidoreductase subunit L, partial [Candidatus Aminicenantia bacterium]
FKSLYTLLYRKYYVDEIYNILFLKPFLKGSEGLLKVVDIYTIDGIAHGSAKTANMGGEMFSKIQTGLVKDYGLLFLLGVVIILGYWLWKF